VAAAGDLRRFENPRRQLMAYLGLMPSEHSSGSKRRQGAITKARSPLARRMLVERASPPADRRCCPRNDAPLSGNPINRYVGI
jgi:transposase